MSSTVANVGGSSPLTRGKRQLRLRKVNHVLAHPRSRGENVAYTFNPTTQAGSSPLTRGKLPEDPHDTCVLGLIPAHAGKTRSVASMSTVRPAHPRSRGENGPLPAEGMELDGSSPLTRGKLERPAGSPRPHRLIPAHAGKTGTAC